MTGCSRCQQAGLACLDVPSPDAYIQVINGEQIAGNGSALQSRGQLHPARDPYTGATYKTTTEGTGMVVSEVPERLGRKISKETFADRVVRVLAS